MKALVIVHLSSLDIYAEEIGLKEAFALAARLEQAILSWDGPVYVIDQRWPIGEWSEPRHELVYDVQLKRDIQWSFFDEWRDDWEEFMVEFRAMLIRKGVKEVALGGIWYEPANEAGAVGELLHVLLEKRLRATVYPDLVGGLAAA